MISDKLWIKLMNAGGKLGCHQMPERSFFIKGYQLPLCARCTGAVLSSLIALLVFVWYRVPIWVCLLLSSVMLVDWGIQWLGIRQSTNTRRLITGLIGGFGYFTLHLYVCRFIFKVLCEMI